MLLLLLLLLLPLLLLLLLLLLQRPALPLTFNTFCTICTFFRLCNCPWQIMRLVHFKGPNIAVYQNSQTCGIETAIWILNYSFFCELCLLQRKEDNQAVIFVICPHNWAFMEACYQLSLGLQVDFSMEWRLLQWHSLTRDKENADPDYYHILYLAIMLLVMMMTMALDNPNLANVVYL